MVESIFLLGPEQKLVEMTAQPYDSEDLLQRLLADYPHLIAGQQIDEATPRRWLLITREMGVPGEEAGNGRWPLDHLFLDQDGIPTLVEVKRSTDSRIRREVIGQMLDYAANAVVYLPMEEIRARFLARHGNEENAQQELFGLLGEDADAEAFWGRVKTNLQAGKVRMIFVADSIPAELKRVVEFLNQQMDPAEVLALELRQYVGEGLKTLVPRVIGNTAIAESKKREARIVPRKWDELSFFDELAKRNHSEAVAVARALLDWSKKNASYVWWGSRTPLGSFIPVIEINSKKYYPFRVPIYGKVEIYFKWLKNTSLFADETMRLELLNHLNEIRGVSLPKDSITRRPSIPLSVLAASGALAQFTKVLDWMVREIQTKTTIITPQNG